MATNAEPIPFVAFDATSAPVLDCLGWASKSIIAGQFVESIKADIPAAEMAGFRLIHGVTVYFSGGPLLAGEQPANSIEMTQAMGALGKSLGVPIPAEATGDALAAIPWETIIAAFMQILLELLRNRKG